ncbi:hypothetical protein EDD11_003495 [Mortierella claussenii]|nr:hypothetical protein EDD11_003495 [Mortierella claussenii]
MVHAAPLGQGQGRSLLPDVTYIDDKATPPGPLTSRWRRNFLTPENQNRRQQLQQLRQQMQQQRQLTFRQFSEKFVSTGCVPILASTLVHLDKVRGTVHDQFKTKASFELLGLILNPLVKVLDMHMNCMFPIEYVSKEDNDASSAQIKLSGSKEGHGDYGIMEWTKWTEENEPELLFKYRLRYLEKNLGIFQHVLKIAPESVRQELEMIGFVQETRVLREHARSLLTCEGVPHVTVAGLEEKVGETGSDSFVERRAASQATSNFYSAYHIRLVIAQIRSHSMTMAMDPAQAALCGLRNVTSNASSKPSGEQPLEEETVDPSPSSPQDKFVWSNEAMMRMVEAVTKGHRQNPDLAAMLF